MMCKLEITFVDESKDLYLEKSGQSSCQRAKTVLACGSSPEKAEWVKHECLAVKHLNFEMALDKCGHTAHYKELTETGNRV